MKEVKFVLPLVSEWPLGPPHYPVKMYCAFCLKEVWLEVTPEYMLALRSGTIDVTFVCTDCARDKKKMRRS